MFRRAFDAYMEVQYRIIRELEERLFATELARYHHMCPCCAIRHEDEPKLKFLTLVSMDGNESLKRHLRQQTVTREDGTQVTLSKERPDIQTQKSTLYVEKSEVDRFTNEVRGRRSLAASGALDGTPVDGLDKTPCVDRWKNLASEGCKCAWAIYDETGIFTATCRHGIVLKVCDMVRSGEL